ncbi:MAG: hypothetical protein QOJ02_4145 [Acidobacteriota bacterium]|jgi:hypothetical protein|nr:hypothetical protein [Acidobacteriota bacterium]
MALSGQLSDLSLAELIEFFCNQRKTGRLKVAYERAPGYFYFDRGDLVDAKIGSLTGIEAIYYALTLANASFKFSPAFEPTRRSIHQPWTQVTLEGLRRLDEGIKPKEPTVEEGVSYTEDPDGVNETAAAVEYDSNSPLPLSQTVDSAAGGGRSKMVFAAVAVAIIALVAVIGIPAVWYGKGKAVAVQAQPAAAPASEAQASNAESNNAEESSQPEQAAVDPNGADAASLNDANALAARRAREARDRARLAEAAAAKQSAANSPVAPASAVDAAKKPDAAKPAPKMISVQVSYDEAGRVTQTSGGDGTAQRIARQKRFPAGKAGTTTITIPIN